VSGERKKKFSGVLGPPNSRGQVGRGGKVPLVRAPRGKRESLIRKCDYRVPRQTQGEHGKEKKFDAICGGPWKEKRRAWGVGWQLNWRKGNEQKSNALKFKTGRRRWVRVCENAQRIVEKKLEKRRPFRRVRNHAPGR